MMIAHQPKREIQHVVSQHGKESKMASMRDGVKSVAVNLEEGAETDPLALCNRESVIALAAAFGVTPLEVAFVTLRGMRNSEKKGKVNG